MTTKRKIEIFSAGCAPCKDAIELVNSIVCPSCDVQVLDMRKQEVAVKAKEYGVRSVPSIAVDGKLAECCTMTNIDESSLRAAGVGVPLP